MAPENITDPLSWKIELSGDDRLLLKAMVPVVDGIAALGGKNCEVLLHSLENPNSSVIKIANGHITGRSVGSPLTDLALKVLAASRDDPRDVIGAYYSRTETGRLFRSVTILVRNAERKPIGMVCVNMDLSSPFIDFIGEFMPQNSEKEQVVEHYPTEIPDLVQKSLEDVMVGINLRLGISPTEKNRLIIAELTRRGVFEMKGSVDIVAGKMGLSKYTLYHYIREIKNRPEED